MRSVREFLTIAAIAGLAGPGAASAQAAPMLGFSPQGAAAQRGLEARFDAGLSAAAISERL